MVIDSGPTPGDCGKVTFITNWELSDKSDAAKGGYIVQDITITWENKDCAGVDVPNADPRKSPLHFYEAWRVVKNSKTMKPTKKDEWKWQGFKPWAGDCTEGKLTATATAKYHDKVDSLPAHMTKNNPDTFAGELWSSTTNPNLGGTTTSSVTHALKTTWDCCPCGVTPTVVVSHTP